MLRMLLWIATLFLAVMLVYFLVIHGNRPYHFPVVLAGVLLVPLVIGCACWRSIIIFNIPGELLIQASEVLNYIAPQGLRPSEALKMSVEDNIGDPHPAEEVFGYRAEAFEEGVRRILGK